MVDDLTKDDDVVEKGDKKDEKVERNNRGRGDGSGFRARGDRGDMRRGGGEYKPRGDYRGRGDNRGRGDFRGN